MKVDRATVERHRASLLEAAGRLFRVRGLGEVSVAEISRAAGLTHGAFYGHYDSKQALAEAAVRTGLEDSAARWRLRAARAREAGDDPVAAIVDAYLTERHRDAPEDGCVLSSVGQEVSRAPEDLRRALADGTGALLAVLTEEITLRHPDRPATASRDAALAALAAMSGGVSVARALGPDADLSRRALASAAALARAAADLSPADLSPEGSS